MIFDIVSQKEMIFKQLFKFNNLKPYFKALSVKSSISFATIEDWGAAEVCSLEILTTYQLTNITLDHCQPFWKNHQVVSKFIWLVCRCSNSTCNETQDTEPFKKNYTF